MNFDVGVELKYIALCYVRTVVEAEFLSKKGGVSFIAGDIE